MLGRYSGTYLGIDFCLRDSVIPDQEIILKRRDDLSTDQAWRPQGANQAHRLWDMRDRRQESIRL